MYVVNSYVKFGTTRNVVYFKFKKYFCLGIFLFYILIKKINLNCDFKKFCSHYIYIYYIKKKSANTK